MDDLVDQLYQEARRLRLIQLRILQSQHTFDQLGAGLDELRRYVGEEVMVPATDEGTDG